MGTALVSCDSGDVPAVGGSNGVDAGTRTQELIGRDARSHLSYRYYWQTGNNPLGRKTGYPDE